MIQQRLVFGGVEVPYRYGTRCHADLVRWLAEEFRGIDAVLVVVDRLVYDHAATIVPALAAALPAAAVQTLVVDAAERRKTLSTVEDIMEYAVAHGLTRGSAVVAMGGGTVGNLAGLAAALLYRGIRLAHLPTTPIAAFDSVISLKQGVNLSAAKNLCGTYHAPTAIGCDLRWLESVPRAGLLTGLAEMVKNVLVRVPEAHDRFVRAVVDLDRGHTAALADLLEIGIAAKVPLLRADPHERDAAVVFEYGHTVGHALEFAHSGAVGHGEAVAWGMLVAAEVSRLLRGLDAETVAAHYRLVGLLDLPDPADRFQRPRIAGLRDILLADNKRGHAACGPDEVLMVLLRGLGQPIGEPGRHPLVRVPVDLVLTALDTVLRTAPAALRRARTDDPAVVRKDASPTRSSGR